MSDKAEDFISQTAAFQKIWLNSMSKAMQAAFAAAPDSPPPELARQIRDAIFQALAEAWNTTSASAQPCAEKASALATGTPMLAAK